MATTRKPATQKKEPKPEPRKFGEHKCHIPHKPVPKGRPRLGRRGRVFTPQTTLDAEALIAAAWDGPCYEGPVELVVIFAPDGITISVDDFDGKSKLRGDIDNYLKTLMDGLNHVAWTDDKQVMQVTMVKQ